MKVAIIGTVGVPAGYGGFESLVENLLGDNCPPEVVYTVFCSSKEMDGSRREYKGAKLKYLPLRANGFQSIAYDILSMIKAIKGFDCILVLGVSGCLFLPVFRIFSKSRVIVNIDGLEHKREKWGKLARWLLKASEASAVKYGDSIVADNKGIQDYVTDTYGKESYLIEYGGDHVKRTLQQSFVDDTLKKYGLTPGKYAITVCRIEPENNSDMILDAFSKTDKKIVFIGNWNHSDWSKNLKERYANFDNIKLLDAIYNLDVLYALRSNAGLYLHGHSAGGTNPSLVEAMFFGIPIATYDVVYNRETTENEAYYFKNVDDLIEIVRETDHLDGSPMRTIAQRRYLWNIISKKYYALYKR